MEIILKPDLSHCVETEAKKEYERVLGLLLGGKQESEPELEDELELLRSFLEQEDFSRLRGICEELFITGKQVEVKLKSVYKSNEYKFEINEVPFSSLKK